MASWSTCGHGHHSSQTLFPSFLDHLPPCLYILHCPTLCDRRESLRKRHKKDVIISILILQVGKLKHRVVTQPGGAAARIPVYLWGAAPGLPPEPSDQSSPILVGDTTVHSVIWSKRLQRWRFSHRLFSNSRLELRTKKRITMHALLIVLSPSGTSVGVEILASTEVVCAPYLRTSIGRDLEIIYYNHFFCRLRNTDGGKPKTLV
ncbi:uncharacterized protein LOC125921645 [Panthera uncia]|uniref:uncharacterized protein LOC125921645 n=1 Tax=Panthera uncia TaxID=29064 RepID=UPI0020FFB772|nr:uncharacterized protein LOC125921645 [Panthera uncia]